MKNVLTTALAVLAAIVLAAAFTFFYGKLYDRKGFRVSILPSLVLLMTGYVLLFFFRHAVPVFAGTLIMLCGYLSGMAVFGAMLRDRTPENKSGMFQGQRIIAQVLIPGIIGPAIGAAVLKNAQTITNSDGTTSFLPNANIFSTAAIVIVVLVAVLLPVFRMEPPTPPAPPMEEKNDLTHTPWDHPPVLSCAVTDGILWTVYGS